jgi:hypothetical protein
MEDALFGIALGFIGGFAGGLLGIGGGAIYVPAMVILLDKEQHLAQGVSLAAIISTAIVGGLTHLRQGNVAPAVVVQVAPVAVLAGFGGALLADQLDAVVLQRMFAVVVVYFSLSMIVGALRGARAPVQGGDHGHD